VSSTASTALWGISESDAVRVVRVSDEHPEVLRYLAEIGIAPGVSVQITKRGPSGGPIFLRIDNGGEETFALSREVAERIWVA
jgi:DtxR family Mn-dependent transcriptional regulator